MKVSNYTAAKETSITVLYFIAYPHRMAGANRSLGELVAHLPEWIEPFVVLTAEGQVTDFYKESQIPHRVLRPDGIWGEYGLRHSEGFPYYRLIAGLSSYLAYARQLYRVIVTQNVDIVHVNDVRGTVMAGPPARVNGCPVISHLRGEFPFGVVARTVFELLSNRIVAVSDGARQTLSERGKKRTEVIYNGIGVLPLTKRRMSWLETLKENNVLIVCCFASVVPFKGHHHLIRAISKLNARGWENRVAFICVGDFVERYERYQQWITNMARELNITNLMFTGWQEDPFAFYEYADLSVLPSVSEEVLNIDGEEVKVSGSEGFPRTHLEAMKFGLPIVGTNIAGVPEQIDGETTGLIVDPGSAEQLADAIETLLQSKDLRLRMGQRGRIRVENLFSTRSYVERVSEVYKDVV